MIGLQRPPAALRLAASELQDAAGTLRTWDSQANAIKTFKAALRDWVLSNQGERCAYCRLPLGTLGARRTLSLDHFAHKAKYSQWTFEALNLLGACNACNTSLKKAADTVLAEGATYEGSTFRIVHPYLDAVLTHIQGGFMSEETVPEPPEGLSTKGKSTIELFELDDPGLLTSWRKEHDAWTMQRISEALSPADLALLLRAVREAEGLGPEH